MILIADGGSTKVDWVALSNDKKELFRIQTFGLNPAVIVKKELLNRIHNVNQLVKEKDKIEKIYFYGAGCGTSKPVSILKEVLGEVFNQAMVNIFEDMLAAVYATTGKNPALVCILGTGSNSCYFNGETIEMKVPSLGYSLMDEASGNYFGKQLLRDYYYNIMPEKLKKQFQHEYDLEVDVVKHHLYKEQNPNKYLASFAKFMFSYKEEDYIKNTIERGFQEFFNYRVLPYNVSINTSIYFVGSIAYYFIEILEKIAAKNHLKITNVIQRPIDDLVEFHKKYIN